MLAPQEHDHLIEILAGLGSFADGEPGDRRQMIIDAGLDRFADNINWNGDSTQVARRVLGMIEDWGYLPENPAYDALGALLSYLVSLPDLRPTESAFLAKLIVRYSLVLDPAYVRKLNQIYPGTNQAVLRPPDPIQAATTPSNVIVDPSARPTFNVAIEDNTALQGVAHDEDYLDPYLLAGALYTRQAVGRIERPEGTVQGTGFLIGSDLLLTCQHVLPS